MSPADVRRLGVAATAVGAIALAACDAGGPGASVDSGPPPPVVEVMRVEPQPIQNEVEFLGQLEADESVTLRSRIAGTVEHVAFEEGEAVEEGQVLFRLDDDEQRARLREMRAELALAEDTQRRTTDLAAKGVVSDARFEQVAAELESARARVEAAEVALRHTRIRAPFDGFAGHRLVSVGARLEPEDPLVDVQAISTLELIFTLPEQALALARVGIPIELTVAPYPGEHFPGVVSFVAPSLNPQNRRLLVKARVPNPDLRLRPGLFAEVHARLGTREGKLVPESAVAYDRDGSFVWRVAGDDTVEPVDVELGLRRGGVVEIRSGLREDDVVVASGTNKLSPGTLVDPVPYEWTAGAAGAAESAGAGESAGGAAAEDAPAPDSVAGPRPRSPARPEEVAS